MRAVAFDLVRMFEKNPTIVHHCFESCIIWLNRCFLRPYLISYCVTFTSFPMSDRYSDEAVTGAHVHGKRWIVGIAKIHNCGMCLVLIIILNLVNPSHIVIMLLLFFQYFVNSYLLIIDRFFQEDDERRTFTLKSDELQNHAYIKWID